MNTPVPVEIDDPELGSLMAWVCQYNAIAPRRDRVIVDFDTGLVARSTVRAVQTPDRNEPCHCGSGKKFKKCCLGK